MRLTLRTLLAYLDEVLEPADRDELAKRIEASDFATDLVHRTKDTMRRLRLSAPQVVGTGMGLDPNTVAEYLDNSLPPDSVADFERICLESDVHLAEVASCHHVLTMVLGEPAEVDPAARQRMYAIPSEAERLKQLHVEPAHSAAASGRVYGTAAPVESVAPAAAAPSAAAAPAHHVPDYLRASQWNRYQVALAALAVVLLVGVTTLLLSGSAGWFRGAPPLAQRTAVGALTNGSSPAAGTSERETATAPPAAGDAAADDEPYAAAPGVAPAPLPTEEDAAAQPPVLPPLGAAPPQPLTPGIGTAMAQLDATVSPVPPQDSAADVGDDAPAPYDIEQYYEVAPAGSDPGAPPPTPPAAATDQVPPDDSGVFPPAAPPSATTDDAQRIASRSDVAPAAPNGVGPPVIADEIADDEFGEPESEGPLELGTYLDGKNILLRYDPVEGAWFRLTPRSALYAGDRLLALPAFYPRVTLASGVNLKLSGGTLVTLGTAATDADGGSPETPRLRPLVDVAYGDVVLINTANNENSVRLTADATAADVRLVPNATLAVEVVRKYVPGYDPRKAPAPVVLHVYARDGEVEWRDADGSRSIAAPGQWTIAEGVASGVSTDVDFPDWIDHEPVEQRSEQLYGVPVVEQSLEATRPVEEQVLELYQRSRRREVKSLLARSSVYVGQFVPFVEALRDSDQKATWRTHIDTLRSAMALGPESAENVWRTLVEQRGEAAEDLYEMLCGYSPDQIGRTAAEIQAGPLARLIDWLDEDSLDYRVLAVQNLGEITGKQLMRNPAGSPTERAKGVRLWRERLRSGELVPPSS